MGKGFPGSSVVKNPPAKAGDTGPTLGREDPLKEGMAAHSSTLAWRIPGSHRGGHRRVRHDLATKQPSAGNFAC